MAVARRGRAALRTLAEADEHLRRAVSLHEEAGADSGCLLALTRLAETATARGQRWRAGRLLRGSLERARSSRLAPHLSVRIHGVLVESAVDDARALAAVRRADRSLAGADVCPPCSMAFRVAATKALARAGDSAAAATRLGEAERVAGMWQGGPWLAAVWEARGVLRRAEGNDTRAAALLTEAAEGFARAGRPLDEQRCRSAARA